MDTLELQPRGHGRLDGLEAPPLVIAVRGLLDYYS
jgi:hypothetical protein